MASVWQSKWLALALCCVTMFGPYYCYDNPAANLLEVGVPSEGARRVGGMPRPRSATPAACDPFPTPPANGSTCAHHE